MNFFQRRVQSGDENIHFTEVHIILELVSKTRLNNNVSYSLNDSCATTNTNHDSESSTVWMLVVLKVMTNYKKCHRWKELTDLIDSNQTHLHTFFFSTSLYLLNLKQPGLLIRLKVWSIRRIHGKQTLSQKPLHKDESFQRQVRIEQAFVWNPHYQPWCVCKHMCWWA